MSTYIKTTLTHSLILAYTQTSKLPERTKISLLLLKLLTCIVYLFHWTVLIHTCQKVRVIYTQVSTSYFIHANTPNNPSIFSKTLAERPEEEPLED